LFNLLFIYLAKVDATYATEKGEKEVIEEAKTSGNSFSVTSILCENW
jgi:hypothetical protein